MHNAKLAVDKSDLLYASWRHKIFRYSIKLTIFRVYYIKLTVHNIFLADFARNVERHDYEPGLQWLRLQKMSDNILSLRSLETQWTKIYQQNKFESTPKISRLHERYAPAGKSWLRCGCCDWIQESWGPSASTHRYQQSHYKSCNHFSINETHVSFQETL